MGAKFDVRVALSKDGRTLVDIKHPHKPGDDHQHAAGVSSETDDALRAMLKILGVPLTDIQNSPRPPQPNGVPDGNPERHRH